MNTHKYYQICYSAHINMSFSPEKRAISMCEWYDSIVQEFTESKKEWAIEKFDRLFKTWMASKSRCASWAIVGPAKFPVARNEKRMNWERKHSENLMAFIEKVRRPPAAPRTELDYGIEEKEYKIGEITVKYNTEQNRLQLIFPGKPSPEMITELKSRGFKWSPRNMAWQRQLTPNAVMAARHVLKAGQS